MTSLLSFPASFSGYESWKSIVHWPIWHRKVGGAPTLCWFAAICTLQINPLGCFTDLYTDANRWKSSGFAGLRQPQLPLETEHAPGENQNFRGEKKSTFLHFVPEFLQDTQTSGWYCCSPWGPGIRSPLSWLYYFWFWDKNQRPLT